MPVVFAVEESGLGWRFWMVARTAIGREPGIALPAVLPTRTPPRAQDASVRLRFQARHRARLVPCRVGPKKCRNERAETIRLISARRASRPERAAYRATD